MRTIDRTGMRYGKLVVIRKHGYKRSQITWECKCDCGEIAIVVGANLGRNTNSCGCMSSRLTAKEDSTTHGMSTTRIYRIWNGMVNRCTNHNNKSYKNYGGRGIEVCLKWLKFEGFYEDMGQSYSEGLSIERKNNDLGYNVENCMWITMNQQAVNKRNTIRVMYNGEFTSLRNYCKIQNVPYQRTIDRINSGMTIDEAINKPKRGDK